MPSPAAVGLCFEGKGVYGFLTVSQGRGAPAFCKKSSSQASVFFGKNLDSPKTCTEKPS
jgi:hypothetical protein